MTGNTETDPDPQHVQSDIARDLRLRAEPPRVMRLSRKAITVLVVAGGLGLGATLMAALQDREVKEGPAELFSTARVQEAEGLSRLPRDYGSIPQLGPPLPGELGRPVLSAQRRGKAVPVTPVTLAAPVTALAVDPQEQLRHQEAEAARLAPLFADTRAPTQPAPAGPTRTAPIDTPRTAGLQGLFAPPAGPGNSRDAIDQREEFLARDVDRQTISVERLQAPPGPYVIQAGTTIPAALITGLRSDLPGQIIAQVTRPVHDSVTGRHLLIPQGARLIGEYDSRIATGQKRLLLTWTRLILPDGRSILLDRESGTDAAGYAGLEDGVDRHWGGLFLAAGLATLLNIALETGQDEDDVVAEALREGAQDTVGRTGEEIVARQIARPPTLTIRPGYPVHVMVTRDLVLEPIGDPQ